MFHVFNLVLEVVCWGIVPICFHFCCRSYVVVFENDALGIRAFVFTDPEGYQIEIQSATKEGA